VAGPRPKLSIFADNSDWIAWTADGYYAASANGEQVMGWHVNNGCEALASYYPASFFRKSFSRPDVIKRELDLSGVEQESTFSRASVVRSFALSKL
jgi:hypothetical protein